MLAIDQNNNIKLTRGDTMTLTVNLTKDNEPYIPDQNDVIRFAVSKGYKGDIGYKLKFTKVIPNDTLTFTCESRETDLAYGTYNYDIEITHTDGAVDTFISAKLTITGEVE